MKKWKQFLIAGSLLMAVPCGATIPTSGLQVWLQADSLGLTDGTAVSSWTDISGNGFNAAQATGAAQPIFKTNIVNGKPIVRFAGVDDVMGFSGSALNIFNNVGGGTIVVVCSDTSGTASHYVISFSSGTSTTAVRAAVQTKTTTSLYAAPGRRLDTDTAASSTATFVSGFHVLMSSEDWTNNAVTLYLDGVASTSAVYSSGGGNTSATSSLTATVGNNSTGANWFIGDVAEIFVYNRVLTTVERNQVTGYLGSKYNITVTGGTAPSQGFFLWFMGMILKPFFEWRQHGFIII